MSAWNRFCRNLSRLTPVGTFRAGLAFIGLLLAGYLLFAPKPWSVVPDPEKGFRVSDYVTVYFWIGAAVNLAMVTFLAVTAQWWARASEDFPEAPFPRPRWFWPAVCGAMLLTLGLGIPRLGLSVWHDEASRVRGTIAGQFKEQPDGTMRFRSAKWEDAFFQYRLPNHVLQSVLSKAVNDQWRAMTRPKGMQFSETAIRLPGFLAGIASVGLLALLLRNLGFASAGVWAAYLLAIHPWHIRYATEARGYAFVLAAVPLMLIFLHKAAQTGRWRWWAALAVTEFVAIYAYATSVYVVAIVSLCAPLAILVYHGFTARSIGIGLRWFVSGLFAAMALLQFLLPCIPQFLAYLKHSKGMGVLDGHWLQDFFSHLLAGVPWSHTRVYPSSYIELYPWFMDHPALFKCIVGVVLTLATLGIVRLVKRSTFCLLVPIALLLPAVVTYFETRARGGFLHEWYLIFLLPGAVAMVALGADLFLSAARTRGTRIAAAASIIALLGAYAVWTSPQRNFLVTRSIQPHRESVLLTRPSLDPNAPGQDDIITATFYSEPGPYDPRMVKFQTAAELGELVRRADREHKTLYVNLGYLVTVIAEHPHKYALLKDPRFFEVAGFLQGLQPSLSREVFRYKPGSAEGFDFGSVPPDKGRPVQPE